LRSPPSLPHNLEPLPNLASPTQESFQPTSPFSPFASPAKNVSPPQGKHVFSRQICLDLNPILHKVVELEASDLASLQRQSCKSVLVSTNGSKNPPNPLSVLVSSNLRPVREDEFFNSLVCMVDGQILDAQKSFLPKPSKLLLPQDAPRFAVRIRVLKSGRVVSESSCPAPPPMQLASKLGHP
jgi:hypothetical protein